MDPITLIISALAAGGSAGLRESASSALSDAYGALKGLVLRKLSGRRDGALAVERHAEDPETWQAPLAKELREAGAEHDGQLVEAAQLLLSLAEQTGARGNTYNVDARGASSFQIGEHGVQHITVNNVTNAGPQQAPNPAPGAPQYPAPQQQPDPRHYGYGQPGTR